MRNFFCLSAVFFLAFAAFSGPVWSWPEQQVTNDSSTKYDIAINTRGDISWRQISGSVSDIYLFNGSDYSLNRLTDGLGTNTLHQMNERGDIIWASSNSGGYQVTLYDGSTGQQSALSPPIPGIPYMDINNNGDVVWQGNDSNDNEIFLYHSSSQQIEQLTNNSIHDSTPKINDNGIIVWITGSGNGTELYRYDTNTSAGTQITNNSVADFELTLNDQGDMAWLSNDGDMEVYVYINSTNTIKRLTNNTVSESSPLIDEDGNVVWRGFIGTYSQIFRYDAASDTVSQLTNTSYNNQELNISSNGLVVWNAQNGLDSDIFLYDPASLQISVLTDNSYNDFNPAVNTKGDVAFTGMPSGMQVMFLSAYNIFDQDFDGVTVLGGDCDNSDPMISPLISELCDGKDNDCDGSIDNGLDPDNDGFSTCGTGCALQYAGDELPQNKPSAWTRTVNPVAQVLSESISPDMKLYTHVAWADPPPGGVICANCHIQHTSGSSTPPSVFLIPDADYWLLSYEKPLPELSSITGTTMEARVKNLGANGLGISLSDGTYTETLVINAESISLFYSGESYQMDTTDDFYTYRLTMRGPVVTVFVNGEVVMRGYSPKPSTDKQVKFGQRAHATQGAEAIWEFVRAYPGMEQVTCTAADCITQYSGNIPPQTSTPVWTQTVSDSALVTDESITSGGYFHTQVAWNTSLPTSVCSTCHTPHHPSDPSAPVLMVPGANYWLLSYDTPVTDLSNSQGTTIEASVHNLSQNGLGLGISDGTYTETLVINDTGVHLLYSGETYLMDTTDGFHLYSMNITGTSIMIHIDGTHVLTGTASETTTDKSVKFGHFAHVSSTSEAYWAFVRAYPSSGNAICPENDCTSKYNADTLPHASSPSWVKSSSSLIQVLDETATSEGYVHSHVTWANPPGGVCTSCHVNDPQGNPVLVVPPDELWLLNYKMPDASLFTPGPKTVEARVHNINADWLGISIHPGWVTETLLIEQNGVRLFYANKFYPMDTTDGFHIYKLVLTGPNGKVAEAYVDGVKVLAGVSDQSTSENAVLFGHFGHADGGGEALWNYVTYYTGDGTCTVTEDNCPSNTNPDQLDSDADGVGDVCDICPADPTDSCDTAKTVSMNVEPWGGILTTQDGSITMSIPSGALDNPTSMSITGIGTNYELTTDLGPGTAVYGVTINPDGQTFNVPVTLTFRWDDSDNNGIVDGTSLNETDLRVTKDGLTIAGPCGSSPGCDTAQNAFAVTVSSLSEFTLMVPEIAGEIELHINPPVLNLSSKRHSVTVHIEPAGQDNKVESARIISVNDTTLNAPIVSVSSPKPGDHDKDGKTDYMVKFKFEQLATYLKNGKNEITLKASIQNGEAQEGSVDFKVKSSSKSEKSVDSKKHGETKKQKNKKNRKEK